MCNPESCFCCCYALIAIFCLYFKLRYFYLISLFSLISLLYLLFILIFPSQLHIIVVNRFVLLLSYSYMCMYDSAYNILFTIFVVVLVVLLIFAATLKCKFCKVLKFICLPHTVRLPMATFAAIDEWQKAIKNWK